MTGDSNVDLLEKAYEMHDLVHENLATCIHREISSLTYLKLVCDNPYLTLCQSNLIS